MAEPSAEPAAASGNAGVLALRRAEGRWEIDFMSEPRSSPQPLWFHLHARGLGGCPVRFRWLNAGSSLGLGNADALATVRPAVCRDGGDWRRSGKVEVEEGDGAGPGLSFEVGEADEVQAAFCFPYGQRELRTTLQDIGKTWEESAIGLSARGQSLPRLRAPGRGPRPAAAYLLARQHAGETPGSWVLDGLLRAVAACEGQLDQVEWWVVPFVDVDGVARGDYGKDALPRDFNRTWSGMPLRPEVLAIQRDARRFAEAERSRILVDLHAPGGAESGLWCFLPREGRPPEQRRVVKSFAECIVPQFPELPADSLSRVPTYSSRWDVNLTASCWAWDGLDGTPGVCIETSYQALEEGRYLLPEDYRETGRRIAHAVASWLLAD